MIKLALLLPQFAPNLYDLAVMLRADRLILQNTETWSRKSRVHRARIRTPEGTQWINIPIKTEDRSEPINRVRIDHERDWITPLLRSIEYNYRNSIYFDYYEPEIRATFKSAKKFEYLQPFILTLQQRLLQFMELSVDYTLAGEMDNYTSDPDELARRLGADTLWQEYDSRHYQRQAKTKSDFDLKHPVYHQHFDGFEPGCCILDVLFQLGPESFRVTDKLKVES